ncbi:hypothetical protein RSOCI_04065 [Rhabdochlamydiaceae symbiont of Dictyostelium giganteum]
MTISSNILTNAGLTKVQLPSLDSSDQTSEVIAAVQMVFELEVKGKIYEGLISQIFKAIQAKPDLLKNRMLFKLIEKESIFQLDEVSAYQKLGDTYYSLGKYFKALECYKKYLNIAVQLKDSIREGKAYGELGNIYASLGKYRKAIELYKKALKIAQELKDRVGEEGAYSNLGMAYSSLGEYSKGAEFYEKALSIALVLQDRKGEMSIYNNLGSVYHSLGQYIKGAELHEKALTIALALQDCEVEEKSYSNLGIIYRSLGEYRKAIGFQEKALKINLELQDRVGEASAYSNLGNAYHSLGEYHKAIEFHEKGLTIALELQDCVVEGKAYSNLGNAYHSLGEHHKAIELHEKALKIALKIQDKVGEKRAYSNLGNTYRSLGDYHKAIEFHKKDLTISLELQDRVGEGVAYGNLGNDYCSLGEYNQAVEFHNKHLEITLELQDKVGEKRVYSNLGNVYDSLGESSKAVEFYEKHLKIALDLQDRLEEGAAYSNLGIAYLSLGEYSKAVEFHEKHLRIALDLQYRLGEGIAYSNLGNAYYSLGKYNQAVEFHDKHLKIAIDLQDRIREGRTYGNLANSYLCLKKYPQAREFYNKHLKIALDPPDHLEEVSAYSNLGHVSYHLGEYTRAEEALHNSIKIAASLQQGVKKSQWQITFFEKLSSPYILLEKTLRGQNKSVEALEVSDGRRARALTSLIMEKLLLEGSKTSSIESLTFQEMKDLAKKFNTAFIVYSQGVFQVNECIRAWILSPKQNEELISISLPSHLDKFKDIDTILKTFPYGRRPRVKKGEKATDPFKKHLSDWYELLIAPLVPYLPEADSDQTLTFIPEGVLAHLPFAAFYNAANDQYLIEKHPVSVAPSIRVLALLDKLPTSSIDQALVMGNPTTPREVDNKLKFTGIEVEEIRSLFNQKRASEPLIKTQIFTETFATAENIIKEAPHSQLLHMAGHGVMDESPGENLDPGFDPHSVFKGLFKLAKDDKHSLGQLRSKEIADMTLKADLVFMSACHLGRGNIKREGSIGPIWSFLGAGAKSTVASYWPLPDSQVTVKMVKTFYQHFLGIETPKVSKAHALREAILVGMQENRDNIEQWGAFFLSGLMN